MRPQKLTLKNFMPFRSTDGHEHNVDFSNLDLFAITGPMASGKSSLIDAIVWCLYGRTARYGADSKGVISAGESTCEVAFDFTIGPRWFRAVRRTGKTTESGLSEREGDEWIQDVSGSDRLTGRIEELLGLDFDSFTKTVVLPQGKYAEFLGSEPSKRRDLLEKILELGVYKRVADRAKDTETRSKARAETIRESLAQPQYAGVTLAMVEQKRAEYESLAQEITQTAIHEEALRELARQIETVLSLSTRLIDLRKEEHTRAEERAQAQSKQIEAEEQLHSLARTLAEVEAERAALQYDERRHAVVKRAVDYLHEHRAASQEAEVKTRTLGRIQEELTDLARQLDDQTQKVEQARHTHEERARRLQADIASGGDIATLTEKLNAAKRWKESTREQERLTQQQGILTQQLGEAQGLLTTLLAQEAAKDQELRELQQRRDQAREEEQEKRRQEVEADHLGKELQEAVQEEKRVGQEAEQARTALVAAEQEVRRQREAVAQAEQQEQHASQALEEDRRKHEVAHLRAALHVGEPCPVCLAPVRDAPTLVAETQGDYVDLQRAVERAKTQLAQARQTLQKAEATAATVQAKKESAEQDLPVRSLKRQKAQTNFVTRFPGFSSLKDALSNLQAQRQELVALLKELEGKTQAAEKGKQELTRQREQAQRTEATVSEGLRNIASSLATAVAQSAELHAALSPFIPDGKDPETELVERRQRLLQSEQEVKAAETATRQAEEMLTTLNTRRIEAGGRRGVVQSEHKMAIAQVDRIARAVRENLELGGETPLPELTVVEQELLELARKQELAADYEQKAEALRKQQTETERTLVALRADLQAREGFLQQLRETIRKTESELDQTQAALRDAIQQSVVPRLRPDGEGVREQLAVVHERGIALRERRSRLEAEIADLERRCAEKEQEEQKLREAETESLLAADLRKLLGAEFTDYLSEGAIKALMRDASAHLQKLTHGRYSFKIESKRRTIDLLIVDHEDQQRARPTHSLSGGETFLASLAIALALSQSFREIATGKAATTSTDCLILDEGFGTLDREGLQLVTETLQELRGEEGRMVGIITHVEEVAAAMPTRIEVHKGSRSSTITVTG
jgi:exonuclease SbcC